MYGTMNSNKAEYLVQPAYNVSVLPTCPPSYSEAVASSSRDAPSTYQLPHPNQHGSLPVVSQDFKQPGSLPVPQVVEQPTFQPVIPREPQAPVANFVLQPSQPVSTTFPVAVGPKRAWVRCQYCHAYVHTEITTAVKRSAHYCCCLLFFCGCFLCSCIPYCLASFKNVNHTCPKCKGFIGTYRP